MQSDSCRSSLRQIIIISGVPRCGKYTLAKMAIKHLIDEGVPSENILFLNFQHPFLRGTDTPM
ncbi:MAG: AAA family ATPase [Thiomicrorhabdus chilensis]|nr:AAA family ATPase [Thiomicrorhabdus chilensis]MDX1347448.1 AAA family ATPase [Thiomicrorhabdus chilensis]